MDSISPLFTTFWRNRPKVPQHKFEYTTVKARLSAPTWSTKTTIGGHSSLKKEHILFTAETGICSVSNCKRHEERLTTPLIVYPNGRKKVINYLLGLLFHTGKVADAANSLQKFQCLGPIPHHSLCQHAISIHTGSLNKGQTVVQTSDTYAVFQVGEGFQVNSPKRQQLPELSSYM